MSSVDPETLVTSSDPNHVRSNTSVLSAELNEVQHLYVACQPHSRVMQVILSRMSIKKCHPESCNWDLNHL